MTDQLEFIFDSSDWRLIVPHEFQKRYLIIESWCLEAEYDAFDAVDEEGELKETLRAAVLNKRTRLLEMFQTL